MSTRPNVVVVLADDMGFSDLGCFGSEIDTPNLDRLGTEGVRLSQFYNTARCSPSRASLLTGQHPHTTGVGILTEDDRPYGYPGDLSSDVSTMAERLKAFGYATCLSGKWHLTSSLEEPSESWPTRRGFDDFYGILGGAGDYFRPRGLYRGTTRLDVPTDPDYYFTDAIGEHGAEFVRQQVAGSQPFFLYLAFTAPHWPLHAPEQDVARYTDRFNDGWDELRRHRFERQRASGVLGHEATLSGRDPDEPAWDDVANKDWHCRRMAVYAAQVDRMDKAVGSVMDAITATDADENTLVIFLSDNGASHETMPPPDAPAFVQRQPQRTMAGEPMPIGNHPSIWPGAEDSYASYGRAWANLSNTPFRRYKSWVHEGGIATPLLARWPAGGLSVGALVDSPHQLTDILPTVLDAAGVRNGAVTELPGRSMIPEWRTPDAGHAEHTLYWEHIGNCAVRRGDHKAVRTAGCPWELYDLSVDRSELHDLASAEPGLLADLVAAWKRWADDVGVKDWATYGQPPATATLPGGPA
ncbi:MAG: arylsulfatase [Actinomycetia bacterium]|nr:arylsulfatase [Actinomycetes bacterium]